VNRTVPQRKRKILLIFAGILLALIVLEIGLRVAGTIYQRRYFVASSEKPDSIRILCLGESSTAGLWVEPKDSYPKQLERRLNEYYQTDRIETIIPFAMGQNSSQIANRADSYLKRYKPKLVIIMMGINNEWSFAENNFVLFLKGSDREVWKLRMEALWDRLRILKVARFAYLKHISRNSSDKALLTRAQLWGEPQFESYPPEEWKWKFVKKNAQAIKDGWAYDVTQIIRESKASGASVLLMNYHVNPLFLQAADIKRIARQEGISFLINDDIWHQQVTLQNLTKQYVLQDGWHPSREGYAFIASNVFGVIRRKNLLAFEHNYDRK
jgi:lysophospholipase L1-like esterase